MYITGRGSQQSGVPHHNLNLERLEKHHLTAPQLQCTHHPQSTEDFTSFNLEFLDSVALGASSWYFPQRSPSTQPPTTPLIPVERPSDLPPVTNPPTPPNPPSNSILCPNLQYGLDLRNSRLWQTQRVTNSLWATARGIGSGNCRCEYISPFAGAFSPRLPTCA